MSDRLVHADNQICFRALCAMETERDAAVSRRAGVVALAMNALRRVSRRRGHCIDCPYKGRCGAPDMAAVVNAATVDTHVPLKSLRS